MCSWKMIIQTSWRRNHCDISMSKLTPSGRSDINIANQSLDVRYLDRRRGVREIVVAEEPKFRLRSHFLGVAGNIALYYSRRQVMC